MSQFSDTPGSGPTYDIKKMADRLMDLLERVEWLESPGSAMCQVLTAWVKEPDGPEFLIGIFDHIELAQVARTSHTLKNDVVYDYCIEPWVIEGRLEKAPDRI